MRIRLLAPIVIAACLAGVPARAQSPPPGGATPGGSAPGATPPGGTEPAPFTRKELLANERVRVLSISLEPDETIPPHTHEQLHIAVALGRAELTDIAADGSEQRVTLPDGGLTLVPPGTRHALRNEGDDPFRAVAIDLLETQTNMRNRCGTLLKDQPTDCTGKAGDTAATVKSGALVPQLETDQTIVSLLTLEHGAEHMFRPTDTPPVVVALEGTDARATIELKLTGAVGKGEKPLKGGDVTTTVPKSPLVIRNTGPGRARFVVVEFKR
jgi:quercetin dioxygenase-like cupin family protein